MKIPCISLRELVRISPTTVHMWVFHKLLHMTLTTITTICLLIFTYSLWHLFQILLRVENQIAAVELQWTPELSTSCLFSFATQNKLPEGCHATQSSDILSYSTGRKTVPVGQANTFHESVNMSNYYCQQSTLTGWTQVGGQ